MQTNSEKQKYKKNDLTGLGVFILLGCLALGICIFFGLDGLSNRGRIVTVRGLAEKEIKANKAVIKITTSFSGDNVKEVTRQTQEQIKQLQDYFSNDSKTIVINSINVYDSKEYYYNDWVDGKQIKVKKDRYYITQVVDYLIDDVEKAEDISSKLSIDLIIEKELALNINCDYIFPELNEIKPQLIAESTKNARIAGEQFAKDSKSKLGKIRTATQGQISISGMYNSDEIVPYNEKPYMRNVRVVSTIDFFLED